MKSKNDGMLLGCALYLLLLPFLALLNGYALSVLWGWFIVPTFEARPLGVLPAIGVAMVVGYLTSHTENDTEDKRPWGERWTQTFFTVAMRPLFALFFGWILHSFM